MARKFGRLVMAAAALGAVAGGVYYYLKNRDSFLEDDFDDDDFDNFDGDPEEGESDRNYVNLDLSQAAESGEESPEEAESSASCACAEEKKEDFQAGIQVAQADAAEKTIGGAKKVEEFFDDEDEEEA